MRFMHSFKVIDQLQQANCRLENNLFHQYAMEVTEIAVVDFILNVVINKERQLADVFGGHYDLAHQAGCRLVAEHAVANLAEKMNLVVTSAGGYPLDATFYQVSKCLIAARDILKENGVILGHLWLSGRPGQRRFLHYDAIKPNPS